MTCSVVSEGKPVSGARGGIVKTGDGVTSSVVVSVVYVKSSLPDIDKRALIFWKSVTIRDAASITDGSMRFDMNVVREQLVVLDELVEASTKLTVNNDSGDEPVSTKLALLDGSVEVLWGVALEDDIDMGEFASTLSERPAKEVFQVLTVEDGTDVTIVLLDVDFVKGLADVSLESPETSDNIRGSISTELRVLGEDRLDEVSFMLVVVEGNKWKRVFIELKLRTGLAIFD